MRVQIEKKIEERKILGPDLRERRRERVREENRRDGARGEMSHTDLEGQVEGNCFSVEAEAVRASGLREREREKEQREQRMTAPAPPWPSVEATEPSVKQVRSKGGRREKEEKAAVRSRRKRTRSRKIQSDERRDSGGRGR